ncbi:MAG TPA: hypothetical protein VES20_17010 [Bryobacteraceae bacterium]|nr:hypothetical protein [Bryobacteraceae bacterium]
MTSAELRRGPGNAAPPAADGVWTVVAAKPTGVTPGLTIEDRNGGRYMLKLDPPNQPELASAADVIGSKFFYALGYNTPENYIVRFHPSKLVTERAAPYRDEAGSVRVLTDRAVRQLLAAQPRDGQGRIRALASRVIDGELIGPFRFEGVRRDDPNDTVPHQDRRELRGMAVFSAWLNHTDAKAMNTVGAVVQEGGRRFIRHYLIDFGAALGSDSLAPKDPRLGSEYFVDLRPAAWQAITFGLVAPSWTRASFPRLTGVGNFEADRFEPATWKPNCPNPAFARMDEDDAFWAARQLATFSDDDIRALVSTGEFSDPAATEWIASRLIERREQIVRAWTSSRLAVDSFGVERNRLVFALLMARH